jgi:hypothetical protein
VPRGNHGLRGIAGGCSQIAIQENVGVVGLNFLWDKTSLLMDCSKLAHAQLGREKGGIAAGDCLFVKYWHHVPEQEAIWAMQVMTR